MLGWIKRFSESRFFDDLVKDTYIEQKKIRFFGKSNDEIIVIELPYDNSFDFDLKSEFIKYFLVELKITSYGILLSGDIGEAIYRGTEDGASVNPMIYIPEKDGDTTSAFSYEDGSWIPEKRLFSHSALIFKLYKFLNNQNKSVHLSTEIMREKYELLERFSGALYRI